jgi:class I fructose-bisphosphate aldolase
MDLSAIRSLLGDQADHLLNHVCTTIPKEKLHVPGPTVWKNIFEQSDRSKEVIAALAALYETGRLAKTGYLSILPVDQGIEHSAGASRNTW